MISPHRLQSPFVSPLHWTGEILRVTNQFAPAAAYFASLSHSRTGQGRPASSHSTLSGFRSVVPVCLPVSLSVCKILCVTYRDVILLSSHSTTPVHWLLGCNNCSQNRQSKAEQGPQFVSPVFSLMSEMLLPAGIIVQSPV